MSKKIVDDNGKTYVEKKPFYKKWWFILICVLFVIGLFASKKGGSEANSSSNSASTETQEKIVYEQHTAKELLDTLSENALKADETYKGKYVEISGQIGNIDSSGKYISIDPVGEDFILTGIQAYIKTDEQKTAIMNLSKGSKITVRGKIKSVGEIRGYGLDIDEIVQQ